MLLNLFAFHLPFHGAASFVSTFLLIGYLFWLMRLTEQKQSIDDVVPPRRPVGDDGFPLSQQPELTVHTQGTARRCRRWVFHWRILKLLGHFHGDFIQVIVVFLVFCVFFHFDWIFSFLCILYFGTNSSAHARKSDVHPLMPDEYVHYAHIYYNALSTILIWLWRRQDYFFPLGCWSICCSQSIDGLCRGWKSFSKEGSPRRWQKEQEEWKRK